MGVLEGHAEDLLGVVQSFIERYILILLGSSFSLASYLFHDLCPAVVRRKQQPSKNDHKYKSCENGDHYNCMNQIVEVILAVVSEFTSLKLLILDFVEIMPLELG